MKENEKFIEQVLNELLHPYGFIKKRHTWCKDYGECIGVISFERSTWGEQYWLDFGVLLKELDSNHFPKYNECHIGGRVGELSDDMRTFDRYLEFEDKNITPKEKEQIKELLKNKTDIFDLSKIEPPKYSLEERKAIIEAVIKNKVLPFLESLKDSNGIKKLWVEGVLRKFPVALRLKKHLSLVE